MGVYATRSPNRANPIGLSAVQLDSIQFTDELIKIRVVGGDFLDGTPVLDIKPYLPFADSIDNATADWASSAESALNVIWSDVAALQLSQAESDEGLNGLQLLIEETIAQDPRPAHERNKDGKAGQTWGVRVAHVDVKWQVRDAIAEIVSLVVV